MDSPIKFVKSFAFDGRRGRLRTGVRKHPGADKIGLHLS
jgi:hypothetical protein